MLKAVIESVDRMVNSVCDGFYYLFDGYYYFGVVSHFLLGFLMIMDETQISQKLLFANYK